MVDSGDEPVPQESLNEKIKRATQSAENQMQFRALVGEFDPDLVKASQDLEELENLVQDLRLNPQDSYAREALANLLDETALELNFGRLSQGMDAYGYGSGIAPDLTDDQRQDAHYFRDNIVDPILRRYRVSEGDLNLFQAEKSKVWADSFTGDEGTEE